MTSHTCKVKPLINHCTQCVQFTCVKQVWKDCYGFSWYLEILLVCIQNTVCKDLFFVYTDIWNAEMVWNPSHILSHCVLGLLLKLTGLLLGEVSGQKGGSFCTNLCVFKQYSESSINLGNYVVCVMIETLFKYFFFFFYLALLYYVLG